MNKSILYLCALAFAGLAALSLASPSSDYWTAAQELPLYEASKTKTAATAADASGQKERGARFARLQTGVYGKPADFTAKARLVFKTEKKQMVAEARAFALQPLAPLATGGWRNEGAMYGWQGEAGQPVPLTLPLAPEKDEKPFRLGNFDEFWLDYTPAPGMPLCTPQLELRADVRPYRDDAGAPHEWVASTGSPFALKVLATIDAAQAKWREKDYGYLARRVLGLAPDEDWRYAQDQKNGVLQRRLHVKLDDVEALDIALLPGLSAERVNLMVGRKDNYGAGELVEFAGLPQNPTLPNGRPGVRLNLREALERRYAKEWAENAKEPGRHHFYLQEVFVFVPGEASVLAAAQPVRSLALHGEERGTKARGSQSTLQRLALASNVMGVNAYRQRMAVDLRKLTEKGEAVLKKAVLRLLPPADATMCAVRIEGLQAVSAYNGSLPAFAREVEDWSRRWGGVFSAVAPRHDQVEQPGIVGYLPLSTLTLAEARQDGKVEYVLKPDQNYQLLFQPLLNQGLVPPYRILGPGGKEVEVDKSRLISSVGAVVSARGEVPKLTVEGDLLVLEGRSQALEIAWPVTARIDEKTWLYFGMGEGAEQLGNVSLTLGLADGGVIRRRIVPNQPLHLVTGEAEVRSVRLNITPNANPYRLKLRELALFSPAAASHAQAFTLALPASYNSAPKPVLPDNAVDMLETQPGRIAGILGDAPLRFATPLDPAPDWVRGLRLAYHLPPSYADAEGCPLTLRLNWANGKTERQLCLDKTDNAIFIPLANMLGSAENTPNLGALRSIDWVLSLPGSRARGIAESFELKFAVEGWAMLSAADRVHLSPLFYAGRAPIFADLAQPNEATGRNSRKIWLPLEETALSRMMAVEGEIRPVEHGLFTLDQVVAEPKQPMSGARWRELSEPPIPYAPPRWPKWLGWASAILLAWASWKKGWWAPGKVWEFGKGTVKIAYCALRWILGAAGRPIWRWLPRFNLAIGVLALGPGLWLAGRLGWSFAGAMLLVASGLVAWGAFCHWREHARQPWPGGDTALSVRFGVLAVALGCAVWSLGQHKLSAAALWGFLPLFGAAYALLPALYRLGRQLVAHHRPYVSLGGWFMLTVILYGLGLMVKVGNGENYFFTFGGMAAVIALRFAILSLQPVMARYWPSASAHIYRGGGALYFSGALAMLVATALLLALKLEPLAEQAAIVVYYCLVVGTVIEIAALRREKEIPASAEAPNDQPKNLS